MRRPFTVLSIIVLLAIAGLQGVRLWLGLDVAINGLPIPLVASAGALVVALLLAVFLWIEVARSRDRGADRDVRGRSREAASRSATRSAAKPKPVWVVNGQRQPADYFMFASRPLKVKDIRDAAAKYDRIMVGFDAGALDNPEVAAALAAARDVGAELEIYVEGPGGPTGNAWSSDERERVRKAAASVGINTKSGNWTSEWKAWGWKAYAYKQLEGFLEQGFTAGEIDNLGSVLGEGSEKLVEFYGDYGQRCVAGRLPRLVMKNISEDQLAAVVAAVKDGTLQRAMFSEFHISEKGAGFNRARQEELSSQLGIRTLASNDTYNYDAFGEFGLATQYAALVPPAPEAQTTEIAAAETGQLSVSAIPGATDAISRPS